MATLFWGRFAEYGWDKALWRHYAARKTALISSLSAVVTQEPRRPLRHRAWGQKQLSLQCGLIK